MNSANFLCMKLSKKWILLHLNRQKCINMHQNVCRTNYSNVLCMKFKFEKFQFFDRKWPIFFLSVQNASIRIRMPQNACRMNCANVLCRKISKKWFLLHLNRLKLKNYLYLFVMEDPVCVAVIGWHEIPSCSMCLSFFIHVYFSTVSCII